MINGCLVGPPVMTHVKFKVDPLLRKTSEDPRMVVLGSEMITIRMKSKNRMYYIDSSYNFISVLLI